MDDAEYHSPDLSMLRSRTKPVMKPIEMYKVSAYKALQS